MFFLLASAKRDNILTMKTTPINGPIALRIRDRLAAVICTRFGSLRAWAERVLLGVVAGTWRGGRK